MFLASALPGIALPSLLSARPAAHELRAPAGTAGHLGLALALLAAFEGSAPVLCVGGTPDWYPPGLAWLGLDPARCLFAKAASDEEALAMAELAWRGGMAGLVECQALSRLAARRLALAARQGHTLGLVLRHAPSHTKEDSTAFTSRWMVHPAAGRPEAPRLAAELLYAKGAMPAAYLFELRETGDDAAPAVAPLHRAG